MAIFCPLSEIRKGQSFDLPKDKKIYIHCKSGGRAEYAERILKLEHDVEALLFKIEDLKKMGF